MATEQGTSPKAGEKYRCESCGMEIQVTKDCNCEDCPADFRCCGQAMVKA